MGVPGRGGRQPCDPGDALSLLQGCPWPSVQLDSLALRVKLHLYTFRTLQSGFLKVSGGLAGGGAVHPQRRAWPRCSPALGASAELTGAALPLAGAVPQETPGRSSHSEPGEEEFGGNFANMVLAHFSFVFKLFVLCKLHQISTPVLFS